MSKPFLVVVTGRPGSGKTTLAREIACRIHCPILSRDEFKEGLVHTRGGSHDSLGEGVNRQLYEVFFDSVHYVVSRGISMVIEAAFQHRLWQPKLDSLASIADVSIVLCSLEPALAEQRAIERRLFDATRERFHGEQVLPSGSAQGEVSVQNYNAPETTFPTIAVDTTNGYDPALDEIVRFLMNSRPG